jgi:hypothetical protein
VKRKIRLRLKDRRQQNLLSSAEFSPDRAGQRWAEPGQTGCILPIEQTKETVGHPNLRGAIDSSSI